jgi:hypothetical protein
MGEEQSKLEQSAVSFSNEGTTILSGLDLQA